MAKKGGSAPAAPDPVATAQAQSAADKETAIAEAALNRITQQSPYGRVSYEQTGFDETAQVPLYTQTTEFSPEQQQLYDINQQYNVLTGETALGQMGRLGEALSTPISYETAPELAVGGSPEVTQQAYESIMSRMNPQMQRDREALESRLAAQGIAMGSEAYGTGMDEFNRARTDAEMQANLQAINLGMAQAGQQNQARQQAIQELASIRNQPLNEVAALISGTQVQAPQFSGVSQVQLPQSSLTQNIYDSYAGQMNQYQANQASQDAMMGGLFGLGGAGLMALGM